MTHHDVSRQPPPRPPLLFILALLFLALSTGARLPAQEKAEQPDAAKLYKMHCQVCHTADGNSPVKELKFVEGEWKHGSSAKEIAQVISEGVKGTAMLSFKDKLTEEEVLALAKYVRAFDKRLQPEKVSTNP